MEETEEKRGERDKIRSDESGRVLSVSSVRTRKFI